VPTCDSPDDEAELAALDVEAELAALDVEEDNDQIAQAGNEDHEAPQWLGAPDDDPSALENAPGTYTCKAPDGPGWTTIRNTPDAFVIGNCANGWTMKRSVKSKDGKGAWWSGGRIWGHYNADGWIRADALAWVDSAANNVGGASSSPSDIGGLFSCMYESNGLCAGGNDYYLSKTCPSYANRGGVDPLGNLAAGTHIQWRYRTPDGQHSMVYVIGRNCAHQPEGENHALGWVYVPASCIEYPPRRIVNGQPYIPEKHCLYDRWNNNTGVCTGRGWASTLVRGQPLGRGDTLYSPNGKARLSHQTDGNLVLYRTSDNYPLWHTYTYGQTTTHAVQQEDGNFVLYNGSTPVWNSGTTGNGGAMLEVQNDCNLVIYHPNGTPIWNTGTWGQCP